MKKSSCPYLLAGIVLLITVCGCGAGSHFVDGLAAVSGQGGKIAREDAFDTTVELAKKLNQDQPPTKWEALMENEAADFIAFPDPERVLVGTVESGSYLGVPRHGEITLYNARTGAPIWSAGRDGLKNGYYALLTTEPLIVVVGRDKKTTRFIAYDPDSGSKKWTHRVKTPDQFIVSDRLDRIISLSATGGDRKIEALDIRTGSLLWNRTLPAASFWDDIEDVLVSGNDAVFAIGKRAYKFALKDGRPLWSKSHPLLETKGRTIHYTSQGLLAYSPTAMALFREKNGSAGWEHSVRHSSIRFATVLDGGLYRVVAANSGRQKAASDTIQALSARNGRVIWSRRIKGKIVSPLHIQNGVLAFTTDDAIFGIKAKSGKQRFRNPFSKQFRSGAPSGAKTLQRPDIIRFRNGKLYLAREMSGIRAYAFPSGSKLWEQMNFDCKDKIYSADGRYSVLAANLDAPPPRQGTAATARPSTSPVGRLNVPSPFIKTAQRRYESERQRTAAILSNRYATRNDRASAQQSRAMNARLMAANQRVDMAMGQMQAAGDLFNAVVGLQGAIQKALEVTAVQGVVSRKYLELRSIMGLQQACFQGKYYLWPFFDKGRGVTLVDLDTGYRHDIIFSPQMLPLDVFGIDLPTFCIGPDGKTLVMAGVGMDPGKYEAYVKWKYRMPKPSTLAYDLSTFRFMRKSLTQKKAEQAAIREKEKAKAYAAEMMSYYEKSKIHTAAQAGNLAQVRSLLDSGVSVNAKHPYDGTGPLIFAILGGNADIVRLLIERGADVNEKTKEGKSALFWAKHYKRPEMITLLKQAGAR